MNHHCPKKMALCIGLVLFLAGAQQVSALRMKNEPSEEDPRALKRESAAAAIQVATRQAREAEYPEWKKAEPGNGKREDETEDETKSDCGIPDPSVRALSDKDDKIVHEAGACDPAHDIGFMTTCEQTRTILGNVAAVLKAGIPGAIVELGCNKGDTSVLVQKLLDLHAKQTGTEPRPYYVYDSFEGLPQPTKEDDPNVHYEGVSPMVNWLTKYLTKKAAGKGALTTSYDAFEQRFKSLNMRVPVMNKGFFGDVPDEKYPDQVAFAFFDGDLYVSIQDSFKKVYDKVSPGGVVLVHDWGWQQLPGAKKAADNFLEEKPETAETCAAFGLGRMIKK